MKVTKSTHRSLNAGERQWPQVGRPVCSSAKVAPCYYLVATRGYFESDLVNILLYFPCHPTE